MTLEKGSARILRQNQLEIVGERLAIAFSDIKSEVQPNDGGAGGHHIVALNRKKAGFVFALPRAHSRQRQFAEGPPVRVEKGDSGLREIGCLQRATEETREASPHAPLLDRRAPCAIDNNMLLESAGPAGIAARKKKGASII